MSEPKRRKTTATGGPVSHPIADRSLYVEDLCERLLQSEEDNGNLKINGDVSAPNNVGDLPENIRNGAQQAALVLQVSDRKMATK